jgi:threonine aldolase
MPTKTIDLRSDTVTQPTLAMREAMASAEVGDDVMRTDPTVIALEERAADLFGKQAALFTPSGTMANLLAILAQTNPGDEIITQRESHIYYYEAGGYAALAGCSVRFVEDQDEIRKGIFSAEALRKAIRPSDIHFPSPSLCTIENTHNRGGGVVWTLDQLRSVRQVADDFGLRVHCDGARIWNASIASGISLKDLASTSDTLSACLSKGLGCPVGSVLVGDRETIERARRKRKMLGGGMRQAGVLAAAGLYAIENHLNRLQDDHDRAKRLAYQLAELQLFDFDPDSVETNLVYAKLSQSALKSFGDAFSMEARLKEIGILCYAESAGTLRFVTHLDLNAEELDGVAPRIKTLCE